MSEENKYSKSLRERFVNEFFAKAEAEGNKVDSHAFHLHADVLYTEWLEKQLKNKLSILQTLKINVENISSDLECILNINDETKDKYISKLREIIKNV